MLLFSFFDIFAQNNDNPEAIEPANISYYTAENGLPICTGNVFQPNNGRLYITTCGPGQSEENVYLYLYDGYKKTLVPFHKLLNNTKAIPIYEGIDEDGTFYGFFHSSGSLNKSVFTFNPQAGNIKVLDLTADLDDGAKILSVLNHPEHGFLIYAKDNQNEYVFRWRGDKSELIAKLGYQKRDAIPGVEVYRPIMLAQQEALWFWDKQNAELKRYNFHTKETQVYNAKNFVGLEDKTISGINSIIESVDNELLTAVVINNTVEYFKYDEVNNNFVTFLSRGYAYAAPRASLKHIFQDRKGNLLVRKSTRPNEPVWWMIEKETGRIYDYTPLFKDILLEFPNPRTRVTEILGEDFSQSLWVVGYGGFCVAEMRSSNALRSFAFGNSRGMLELDSNYILVKSENDVQGFIFLNTNTLEIEKVPRKEFNCLLDYTYNNLSDILADKDGNLFIPSNSRQKKLIIYNASSQSCSAIDFGFPFDRLVFVEDQLLATVNIITNELFYFDLNKNELYPAMNGDNTVSFGDTVFQLKLLSDGNLLAATRSGLFKMDIKSNELISLNTTLPTQDETIYYIDEATDGNLWLATANSGVLIYNPENETVNVIDEAKGLSNNTAIGILKDDKDIRWVNTYNGVNLISPNGKVLTKLFAAEGLINDEGNRFSSLKTTDGKLLFGSVMGATLIDPEKTKEQFLYQDSIRLALSKIKYYDESIEKDTTLLASLNGPQSVELEATQRYIDVNFSLSDFRRIKDNNYKYRFEKTNSKEPSAWFSLGSNPELTLTNLPAGDYDLVLEGYNFRGQKAQAPIRISINAKELFYKTTWFYALVILIVSVLPIVWYVRERKKRQRLEQLVSERTKKIEEDKNVIEEQAERLKSLDEAKSNFFANISHEFRTPLTVISGMVDQMEKDPKQWLKKGSKMIKQNNADLLNLVNQILDLQKLESGALEVKMVSGDILRLIRAIFNQLEAFALSKEQNMLFTTAEEEIIMDFDQEKLLRIISNLLSNAIKYTPEKGNVTLEVNQSKHPDIQTTNCLEILIKDTGIGIPKEQLPFVFDRFYQAKSQENIAGTGIGLSLTLELVKLLGGKIEVESEQGKGTVFKVYLPITQEAKTLQQLDNFEIQNAIFGRAEVQTTESSVSENLPIALLVEDNADIAKYVQICLKDDYNIVLAINGEAGIEKAYEIIPDIIISDVMMPKKNGFELTETLKDDVRTSHIPIILLTAKSDVESRISGLKYGADDYLAKPFHQEELLVRMKNTLEVRKILHERYSNLYAQNLAELEEPTATKEDEFILKLKEVFEPKMDDPNFNLNQLSDALFLSRSQFGRKVKALTDRSPALFIRSIRLQKAKQLLTTTQRSIKEIAYEVGFSDPAYFSRAFTEEYGESPTNIRT